MKTLTTLIAVVATSFALNANAEFTDTEVLGIGEIFPIQTTRVQSSDVVSASNPNEMVWDSNSEGYIANSIVESSIASALFELENNPPAAGRSNTNEVFIYNELAGEHDLQ